MKEEVRIPSVGESIVEGMLMTWFKANGDYVKQDEDLYEFETEKANVVVPSPFPGILEIIVPEGTKVAIGQTVARIDTGAAAGREAPPPTPLRHAQHRPGGAFQSNVERESPPPGGVGGISGNLGGSWKGPAEQEAAGEPAATLSPAVRRVAMEKGVDTSRIAGTGRGGRITKGDALKAVSPGAGEPLSADAGRTKEGAAVSARGGEAPVKRVAMSPIRKTISHHLLAARHEAAHLTTFNEINMEKLQQIRKEHQSEFEKLHGVRLGIMSFFVKAAIAALKEFPVINARIEGDDIVYYNFYDIGVAVSTDRGLLVPVLRNADAMTFAEIEKSIADLAERAVQKKILLPELQGGTFSITNGGVFGSLMSTPIPNHPQSAILGMHAIKDRPVAVQGEVRIKPMMYVALTYDHRLIDGREAVSFLVRIKEYIEDPESMLLEQ